MRKIHLVSALVICPLLCAACATAQPAAQPYQEYIGAYQLLQEADNFAVQRTDDLFTGGNWTEENSTHMLTTCHVAHDELTAQWVVDEETVINLYYRDGLLFSQNTTNPAENYRVQRSDDFVRAIALEGVINFPPEVIASQSGQDTAEGRLLTFEMDAEKYYEYRFPQTFAEEGYGGFQTYREPPLYTVLLDKEGRIIRVSGSFCTVNSDAEAFTWDASYIINFSQYSEVTLDFPELNEADFPVLAL